MSYPETEARDIKALLALGISLTLKDFAKQQE